MREYDDERQYAWIVYEKLLATSPTYQNAADVRDLLADARLKSNLVKR
jgi:hypothetical protein